MKPPNPNGFKDHERRSLRKRKVLVREIEAGWNQPIPPPARWPIAWLVLESLVDDLAERLPKSLLVILKKVISDRDFPAYLKLSSVWGSPQMYDYPGSYFAATTVLSLLKKTLLKDARMDPEQAAVERFRDAERRCGRTNVRFKHYRDFDFSEARPLTKRLRVHEVFHLARQKIQSWLGPLVVKDILADVRHGPGGCVGLKRPYTTPYFKFGVGDYTVSEGAYWHAMRTFTRFDGWVRGLAEKQGLLPFGSSHNMACVPFETRLRLMDHCVSVANYNEVTFVDKNAKTKRSIAIEPRLNVALQLSVGTFLKKRLAAAGCDLKDQSRNQELAFVGSVQHGSHDPVTIDLEMASDTMSVELVRELLPPEWFEFLDDLRSHQGKFKDELLVWEKFSSMGNGFTFELESMIFYALAQAVSDLHDVSSWFADTFGPAYRYAYVSVFGDDIIVPAMISEHLVQVLRFCGFRTNEEKSFLTGLFRESCGKDYFAGVLVRPFNFERPLSRCADLVHLHNGLKWLSEGQIQLPLEATLGVIQSLIPDVVRHHLVGSQPTIDDGYIWVSPDEVHRSKLVVWDVNHQSWLIPVIRQTAQTQNGQAIWRYVQFLYSNTERWLLPDEGGQPVTTHWDQVHVSAGGSSGDVVISGGGPGVLRLQGW